MRLRVENLVVPYSLRSSLHRLRACRPPFRKVLDVHRLERGCFGHRAEVLELAREPEGLLEVCGVLGAAPLAGAIRRLPDERAMCSSRSGGGLSNWATDPSKDAISTFQACFERNRPRVLQFQTATLSAALRKASRQA